ncbi:MAG: glycosyltransferase family 4 protein [Syntrophales bacterium]
MSFEIKADVSRHTRKIVPSRIAWGVASTAFFMLLLPAVRSYFFEFGRRWFYILLFSSLLSFILTPLMRRLALKYNVVDAPEERKIHLQNTPLLGGLAIVVAFSAALIANMILDRTMILLICGGLAMAFMSLEDDWREISAAPKLLFQVLVVMILIYNGVILDVFSPRTLWGYWLDVLLTVLWIVGITNAMNFMDGMDGLAAGISGIMAFFLGIVASQTQQPVMGWAAAAVMGSCLGFLPYNFRLDRPASIFLGDTGSTFLGFTLATLAVIGDWSDDPVVSFSAPLLIFWVLIFDMTYITIERVLTGKVKGVKEWIDYVGKDHIHHRMYDLLGDRRKAVFFIYFLCATLGISAIALRNARTIDGILLVGQALLITVIVSILEYSGRNRQ